MRRHKSPELIEEKEIVEELYSSNRKITSQLRIHSRELTERIREQTELWETDARISHEREPEYMTLLRAVTSKKREQVRLLMETTDERTQLQQLRSETSKRDQPSMLLLYQKLRAFGVMEAEDLLPRWRELNQECEEAVQKLEEFVGGQFKEIDDR